LTISGGYPVQPKGGSAHYQYFLAGIRFPKSFGRSASTLIFQFMLVKNKMGGCTRLLPGGNLIGAAEVGIKISRIKIGNFIMCSIMGGNCRYFGCFPDQFQSIRWRVVPIIMFMAIASSVIGGDAP